MINGYTVIYRDDNPVGARTIWINLIGELLNMSSQDVGPELEKFFGRDTYERFVSGVPLVDLKRVLMVDSNEDMIECLKSMFGKNSGIDDFQTFLKVNGIPFKSGSY